MSLPFVGEIRMVGFNFQINGWNFCNGALIAISENSTLFQLIGTTYGGDGQQTFALPDLQGRVAVHQGTGFVIGQKAGVETVTVTSNQMPIHSHPVIGTGEAGDSNLAGNALLASGQQVYSPAPHLAMNPSMVSSAGGSQPHENMQPFLTINFVISLFGVFPTPS
jgi:microcystin-dependent protein